MGTSRFSFVLAIVAALVAGFLLGSASTPASATPPPLPCFPADLSGKPLVLADFNLRGQPRCFYGASLTNPSNPCPKPSNDGRVLLLHKHEADGQDKCVYGLFVEAVANLMPLREVGEALHPPESTTEATP